MKRYVWRVPSLVLVAVALVISFVVQASAGSQVRFRIDSQVWAVTDDGSPVETFDNALEAQAAASSLKTGSPEAQIGVQLTEQLVAVLDAQESPPLTRRDKTSTTRRNNKNKRTTTTTAQPTTTQPTTTQPTTTQPTTTQPTTTQGPTTSQPPTTNGPSVPLVLGQDFTEPSSSWQRPTLGSSYEDPAYGLPVTRMTSADGTRFNRNDYSRRQAENVDGTMFLTYHGEAKFHVYLSDDGSLVRALNLHPDSEPQWHPTNPSIIRYTSGSNSYVGSLRLFQVDVVSGQQQTIADLTNRVQRSIPTALYLTDGAEGAPSADGNIYAWRIMDASEDIVGIATYDLGRDLLIAVTTNLTQSQRDTLDAISVSPQGDHVIAQFNNSTLAYDINLSNPTEIFPGGEHSDTMIGADGDDYYVYIDFTGSIDAGWAVAYNLRTGQKNRLFDLYDSANTSIHFSGKAFDAPGWVVASTYNCKVGSPNWSCEKVFAVNIHDGTMVNLAHTYNCGDSYWTETHASANRDLSRVYFNSDAGSCGIDAEVYRIDVPTLP